jgi:Anticodon binding domain
LTLIFHQSKSYGASVASILYLKYWVLVNSYSRGLKLHAIFKLTMCRCLNHFAGEKAVAEKQAAVAEADNTTEDIPPKKKHHRAKRKKSQGPEDESNLPPEELSRRRRQKELRDIALKLRAQGKEYNHNKYRRRALTLAASGGLQDDHKPRRTVQVIIIPIFWNSREDEKSLVLGAAGQAQAALRHAGVKCDTDTTHKLTPGQKYRHWEERGVMIRVEIGPQEAADGVCLLAQCKTVGEVAEKRTINLGGQLVRSVATALDMKIDAATVEAAEKAGAAVQIELEAARAREEAKAAKAAGGKISTDVNTTSRNNKIVFGGDDLDGDFDEAVLLGKEDDGDGRKEKKKSSGGGGDDNVDEDIEGDEDKKDKKKAKKKSKIVTF